jgi:hypothetical protein
MTVRPDKEGVSLKRKAGSPEKEAGLTQKAGWIRNAAIIRPLI